MSDVTLAGIEAAAKRISGAIRRTPMLRPGPVATAALPDGLALKLENLQVAGSFKARGAANTALSLDPSALERGLITASGGNHGLGVAAAARAAGVPAVIHLPTSTAEEKIKGIRAFGAEVVVKGDVWDDANALALVRAEAERRTYVHPFAQGTVIEGQGTLGLEILEDLPDLDTIIVAIGGGGLISGIATAIKARKPGVRVIGVEPTGAPTLFESRKAGRPVTLDRISTRAGTLAPRRSADMNFAIIERLVDDIVLVSDEEMRAAARWLWFEFAIGAELAGAAGIAALLNGRVETGAGERVCAIICGAGLDGIPGHGG
ncbi:MAG: pyridoxal-phosphate dependent enzyme [Pseudomonadota bacterium]|nr:pyridoxal-phosphate dependent enzyme [Pseudomonadota bacterium]